MKIRRRFTQEGAGPYAGIAFDHRVSEIKNPDGSIVFRLENVEVPAEWSQVATDILAQKYFRKAGVNAPGAVDGDGKALPPGETSARQVFHRLAGCWPHWGRQHGYFDSDDDAQAFYDEMCYMLATQIAAPNSPQWFNTGLHYAYGIAGPAQGHYFVDPHTGALTQADNAYERPQPHACFIQSVTDDLVNDGGIMDLWVREARLFKYGSGTGTNFSQPARRERAALRRRALIGPHVVPAHRRPRGGRDQVRRHHASRGQDGLPRARPSRHRELRRLEGGRGAEGRRAGRRLAGLPPPAADASSTHAGEAARPTAHRPSRSRTPTSRS